MSWHEMTLGEAIHIKHGFAFKGQWFADSGKHIVLTPGNFHEIGGFRLRPGKDRYYAGDIPEGFILEEDSLIVAMTEQGPGLLGSSALIPSGDKYLHNQRLGLVDEIDERLLSLRYLYYLFNTYEVRGQISSSASGVKVRHTSPDRIYRVKVSVPSVKSQEKIASILSAYDGLIENNRRRIQLLEESARLLYKEWFIRLRFPGHEHVKVVDGVPGGWEKKTLGEVAPLSYGKALKQEVRIPGPFPVYGSSGDVGNHNKALVKGPGIILGRKGNVGSVFWSSKDFFPIDTVYFLPNEKANLYLYYVLMHMSFISTDVAVPGLNRDFAHSKKMLIPDDKVMMLFDEQVMSIHSQIDCLNDYNTSLAKARDLLLPRLMNGEMAV